MFALRLFLAVAALAQTAAVAADYIGSEVCKTCHNDIWSDFYRNPHYKSIVSGKATPENTGCEGCHGPGAAHVDAGGTKPTIVAFSNLAAEKVQDACLRCHSQTLSRANIRRSVHTQEQVICTSCHSIHGSQTPKFLLAKRQTDLCYGCHSSVRAQFAMPFKHRVNEGVVQCSDCHNPHGSVTPSWTMGARPRMTEQAGGSEEACLKCHADKRGPFVYEHPGARLEGCKSCHSSHGSMNARMLRRPTVFTTCLECHNGSLTVQRVNSSHLSTTHNLADPRYQNCTTCHPRIHGSNSDQLFMR